MFIPLHDQNTLTHIRLQFITLALIVLNILLWLYTATSSVGAPDAANVIYYSYGFIPAVANDTVYLPAEYVVLPQPASYLSYAFFHGGFLHLAGNMLFLWVFGDNVEDAMGHFRFLVFYLLCAIAGAIVHGWALPESEAPLVGASGATAGVVTAYLLLHPKVKLWILFLGRIPLRLSAMWVIGAWIAYQFYSFALVTGSEVSWAAHIGGIIAGCALVFVLKRRNISLFDRDISPASPHPSQSKEAEPQAIGAPEQTWGRQDDNK